MGVYRFLLFPLRISTAPGEYQARLAHQVLEGFYLNGAVDTVVYGKYEKDSLGMFDMIFGRMAHFNVQTKQLLFWYDISRILGSHL